MKLEEICNEQEVDDFLDIIVDGYEDLVRDNRELVAHVKELEEMVKNKGGL